MATQPPSPPPPRPSACAGERVASLTFTWQRSIMHKFCMRSHASANGVTHEFAGVCECECVRTCIHTDDHTHTHTRAHIQELLFFSFLDFNFSLAEVLFFRVELLDRPSRRCRRPPPPPPSPKFRLRVRYSNLQFDIFYIGGCRTISPGTTVTTIRIAITCA